MNRKALKTNETIKPNMTISMASSSSAGSTTAISNRKVMKTDNMLATEKYTARIPKSSEEYNRVRTGDIRRVIICPNAVPIISFRTLEVKSLFLSHIMTFIDC
jgi:hypothetical protein